MREILFRGKTIKQNNGVTTEKPIKENMWVYGNLTVGKIEGYKSDMISNKKEIYYINPETVGQFTGLTDKNDQKIFEGDIVEITYNDRLTRKTKSEDYESYLGGFDLIEQVVFYKGSFCSMVKIDDIPLYRPIGFDIYEKSLLKTIEVIGNIHDNPELLGV